MRENEGVDVRAREDEWLVVRCQLGERPAFDELVQRWAGPIWKYVRRLTGDEDTADDIAQEVWLRVVRGIGALRDGTRLRPWLFSIARRVLMDRLRRQYSMPAADEMDVADIAADESSADLEEDLASLEHAVSSLPMIEREVLTLFYLQELSLNAVAEVLGIPPGTVKSRLFRARQLLRRELDTKGTRG